MPTQKNLQENLPKKFPHKYLLFFWGLWAVGMGLIAGSAIWFSDLFGYQHWVFEMPLLPFFGMLVLAGCLYLFLPLLITRSLQDERKTVVVRNLDIQEQTQRHEFSCRSILKKHPLILFIFLLGLFLRFAMFFTEPLMEDDYQRYLWDGAVTANGFNPYKYAPYDILHNKINEPKLRQLAKDSGKVLERVNHPEIRTIYPPLAQLVFATSYYIKPFELNAWRFIALLLELTSFSLLAAILIFLGKSLLWTSLYWLNPLVIKEVMNAGHMEVMLVPLLLAGLYLSLKGRVFLPVLFLSAAAAVKLWPIFLIPTVLYKIRTQFLKVAGLLVLSATLIILMFLPVLLAGFDKSSGFVAYAQRWQTNNFLTPWLVSIAETHFEHFSESFISPALAVRLLLGLGLAAFALYVALRKEGGSKTQKRLQSTDHAFKFLLVSSAVFLFSPAQFPWYALWFLPFTVFFPVPGLLLIVVSVQVYYLGFYYMVTEETDWYRSFWIRLEWFIVWSVLLIGMVRNYYLKFVR